MAGPDDGWETITDPGDVPADIRKSLGVAGVRTALGLSSGTGASGKAIPEWADKKYSPQIETYAGLSSALSSFKDDFGGNTITGGLENKLQGLYSGFGSEGQRDWWATFKTNDNQIRNKLFGSALTDTEKAAYEATTIDPSMDPKEIRRNLTTRRGIVQKALQRTTKFLTAQGYNPESIAALAGEYAPELGAVSVEQAKGGDQQSGAVGAVAGGSGAPPTGPSAPTGGGPGGGAVVFNDQAPAQVAKPLELKPEQTSAMQALVQSGASADAIIALGRSFGANITPENAQALQTFYSDPKNRTVAPAVNVDNTVKAVDPGDGSVGAFARGITSNVPFSREIAAGVETIADPTTTLSQNLDEEYGKRKFVEDNNGAAYTLGAVAGSLPLGGVEFAGARTAARTAFFGAYRAGTPVAEARAIANRVFATRTAAEAAGMSGVYGLGNADGSVTDRLGAGAVASATGAVLGGAAAYGGSRFAQALAARRAARAAAVPSEAARLAGLAQQQGIKILPQDIAEGPMVGRMTAGQAQTPFGTNTIRKATDDLYNSFSTRVRQVGGEAETAADVGGVIKSRSAELASREGQRADETSAIVRNAAGEPTDITGAGIVAQRGATRWMEQTAERANQLYARVPIQPEADAALNSTRGALRELNEGMRSNPELGAIFSNPRLQALERAVTDEIDPNTGEVVRSARLSWQDLQEFRTRIGDALDDPRLSEKIASRQLRRLYGALSDDMRATAEAQGPDALRAWRRANDYYDGRMKRVSQTLSSVLGERRDRTPSEAMSALNGMLREGSTGDASRFSRVMRSMAPEDARTVRATIVNEARGGRQFDPKELSSAWGKLSERGKSALLPQTGLRSIMDDAAERAAASQRDPLANKSAEQVVASLEDMGRNRGDSAAFRRQMASLSPDEASSVRALLVHRMGQTKADAVRAGDGGEVFSISHFLTSWEKMTPEAKSALFGAGEMRSDMDALAELAKRVQGSEALRGHSNTGAINNLNATTGGLATAAVAALMGHPIVAVGLAAPAVIQRVTAEALTSPRLLRWLARAPKKPNLPAQRAHIARLSVIARSEPAIAADVLNLQRRLAEAFGSSPARLAAEERDGRGAPVQRQNSQGASANQGLQP